MKLVTFEVKGESKVGVVTKSGEAVLDLRPTVAEVLGAKGVIRAKDQARFWIPDDMAGFLEGEDNSLELAHEAYERFGDDDEGGYSYKLSEVKLKAPVMPSKIVCIGGNYASAAIAIGMEVNDSRPDEPNTFSKGPNSIIGPGEPIVLPKQARLCYSELEMVVVMGKKGRHLNLESAMDHVVGYTVGIDFTAHDLLFKNTYYFSGHHAKAAAPDKDKVALTPGLWLGKTFDTFCPVGPWIVTKDEIPDPHKLYMELKINGKVLQSGSIEKMVCRVPNFIRWVTSYATILPGDLLFTGSLEDWQPIHPGDILEASISKIGSMRIEAIDDPTR
jgi:2-keto-4-pentenoate hydratase/2-oxohepta-3-ene-1,7-dioic acid hydratase in catechol pathway